MTLQEAPVGTDTPAETPTGSPVLVLEEIVKRFGERTVLDGADLTLRPGRVAWLGGSNGAGKTTLLRVASGLIVPEAGTVHLLGCSVERQRRSYQTLIGVCPAGDRGLYGRLTARQNLEFTAGLAMMRRPRAREAIAVAVERFALGSLVDQKVGRLSMGQRQRVRLAMAFLHDPSVVLLDEPRTSLDEEGLDLVHDALGELCRRGGTALWCSPRGDEPRMPVAERYELVAGKVMPC